MAARGIGLDLNTLPVIAVGVGFGIDYGIYILSRVQERTSTGMPLEDAVRDAIGDAGRTVAFTALTMTAGVLCFTLTDLRFVAEMAVLLALWMATSAGTALVTLPAASSSFGRDSSRTFAMCRREPRRGGLRWCERRVAGPSVRHHRGRSGGWTAVASGPLVDRSLPT